MNTKLLKLDPSTQMLIHQYTKERSPNGIVLYALWFVTGLLGFHYLYLFFKCASKLRVFYFIYFLVCLCTFNLMGLGWAMDVITNMVHLKINRDGVEEELVNEFSESK